MKRLIVMIALCLSACVVHAQVNGIARIDRVGDASIDASTVTGLPEGAFAASGSVQALTGAVDGAGWWRVQPTPGHGAKRLLLVYHPYSTRVTVLVAPHDRPQVRSVFDADLDPRFSRRALAFALTNDAPVYIGIEDARYPLQVAIQDADGYIADDLVHVRVISLVTGVLAGISLVVLLFWATLRERVYLLYALTMVLQLLYLLCAYGEAYALPGLRWLAVFGAPGIWMIATLATAAASFFLIHLTDLDQYAPWPSRLLRWIGGYWSLLLVALLLSPWPTDKAWFPLVGNLSLLLANLFALVGLMVAFWRGDRRAGYAMLAWVPLVFLSTARAVQLSTGAAMTPWVEYGLPLILAFASILLVLVLADRMLAVRRERDSARLHAVRDALTGVLNRHGIVERLEWIIPQMRSERRELSVAFLDLDLFKHINDSHGHAVGDACLRALVRVASAELQYGDLLGRIGGEEFLLVLPGAGRRHARDTAERIRRGVEEQCARIGDVPVALTVSIGVAQCCADDGVDTLLARSDQAMYAAKHAGRNRVVLDTQVT